MISLKRRSLKKYNSLIKRYVHHQKRFLLEAVPKKNRNLFREEEFLKDIFFKICLFEDDCFSDDFVKDHFEKEINYSRSSLKKSVLSFEKDDFLKETIQESESAKSTDFWKSGSDITCRPILNNESVETTESRSADPEGGSVTGHSRNIPVGLTEQRNQRISERWDGILYYSSWTLRADAPKRRGDQSNQRN